MRVAFLFDNDGVLIDSSALHWRSWELLMEEAPELEMDRTAFERSFGKRNDLILQEVAPHSEDHQRAQWAQRKEQLFRTAACHQITLLPGIEIFLQEVKEAKIPRIIASSTPKANLEMFLSHTPLSRYFDDFVSAEEVAHGKPSPDVFIAAAHRLGFEPNECVVFEDAPAGILAGKRAGCYVVALTTTHQQEELSHYDLLYGSAYQLHVQEILNAFMLWKMA